MLYLSLSCYAIIWEKKNLWPPGWAFTKVGVEINVCLAITHQTFNCMSFEKFLVLAVPHPKLCPCHSLRRPCQPMPSLWDHASSGLLFWKYHILRICGDFESILWYQKKFLLGPEKIWKWPSQIIPAREICITKGSQCLELKEWFQLDRLVPQWEACKRNWGRERERGRMEFSGSLNRAVHSEVMPTKFSLFLTFSTWIFKVR